MARKGAMVGLGNVALNGHIPAWKKNPDFEIVAGIDPDPQRKKLFLEQFPQAQTFSSFSECQNLSLDFVDICTPPYTHCFLIEQALMQNLHVICEKPLVLLGTELARIEELSKKNSKIIFTVHNWKYAPLCRKVAEIMGQGSIGSVRQCAWYVLRKGPALTTDASNWRLDLKLSGGGILVDHGWHAFYLILQWIGLEPKMVQATLENRQFEDLPVEDTALVRIDFESANGSPFRCEIFLTWASRIRRNSGVIEGSHGSLHIEDQSVHLKNGGVDQKYAFDSPLSQGSHHPEWFEAVIAEFRSELENPRMRGTNFRIAKSCLRLLEKSRESNLRKIPIPF